MFCLGKYKDFFLKYKFFNRFFDTIYNINLINALNCNIPLFYEISSTFMNFGIELPMHS